MRLSTLLSREREAERFEFGTTLGESKPYAVIVAQWPFDALAYRFPIDRFPVTHQAEMKVVREQSGKDVIVFSIGISEPETEMRESLEAYPMSFMVNSSSSGILIMPNSIGSFGALGTWVEDPEKTRKSEVKGFIEFFRSLFRPKVLPRHREASLEDRFHALATQWLQDRDATASITKMCMHPTYQQIIGMGPSVVPLLLRELEREPDYWFWALKAITGEDPVPHSSRGKLREMVRAWLQWGSERGFR